MRPVFPHITYATERIHMRVIDVLLVVMALALAMDAFAETVVLLLLVVLVVSLM